jgi:hypothetical protein
LISYILNYFIVFQLDRLFFRADYLDTLRNKLGHWDSRFVLFLYELDAYCKAQNIQLDMTNLPVAAQGLLHQASAFPVRESGQKVLHETALLACLICLNTGTTLPMTQSP